MSKTSLLQQSLCGRYRGETVTWRGNGFFVTYNGQPHYMGRTYATALKFLAANSDPHKPINHAMVRGR